jgi:hypothetical protein
MLLYSYCGTSVHTVHTVLGFCIQVCLPVCSLAPAPYHEILSRFCFPSPLAFLTEGWTTFESGHMSLPFEFGHMSLPFELL